MKINLWASSGFAAIMATVSVGAIAEAGTIRHDRYDWQYTNLANSFSSVGMINYNGQFSCSGTLINSSWVLTAGHCVADFERGFFPRSLGFSIGGRRYTTTNLVPYHGWLSTQGSFDAGYDIALMRLSSPVRNVTPSNLYRNRNERGQVTTYVGFGSTGTGYTGDIYRGGRKRAGNNVIDGYGGWYGSILYTDFDNPEWPYGNRMGSPYALNLEYTSAPGDSGGGLFLNGLLAGVVSGGDGGSRYGEVAVNTRVSSFASWIDRVISSSGRSNNRVAIPPSGSSASQGRGRAEIGDSLPLDEDFYPIEGSDEGFEIAEYDLFEEDLEIEKVPEPSTIIGLLSTVAILQMVRRRKQLAN